MKTFWLVCTFAGSGSYSFKIKLSSLPTQVVITLLSPSPKCNKCVRYFESSNPQFENWDMNPSANLLIANSLGIFKSPLSNKSWMALYSFFECRKFLDVSCWP